jgi:hypothetical protein
LFHQVFERFDKIDGQLDDIPSQLKEGFQAIVRVIQEAFATQELDEWINFHLAVLNEVYRAYLDPSHTFEMRRVYEDIFCSSCQQDHLPFTTNKALYSHSCLDCKLLDGKSNQYILDAFVGLANANFQEDEVERVLWFRGSFGTVLIASMTQAIYLHSVCLYQPDTVCQFEDPVWKN